MIIAIDVGGTKISAALISIQHYNEHPLTAGNKASYNANDCNIIEQRKIASVIHTDLLSLSQHLFALCQDWLDQSTQVAIACTGQVGENTINFLSAKQSLPLKKQLEDKFNLPVTIINDAAAAAWAEYSSLHDAKGTTRQPMATDGYPNTDENASPKDNTRIKNDTSLVYITVSTGIGGGMIQNGQLVTSIDGFCAHLGHVSVQHSANKNIVCHCGRINCAEAIASGTAIAKQASIILNKSVSCKQVFEEYLTLPAIAQLIDHASSAVCDLIANAKAITGTETVVLGGSVGSADIFHQQVVTKVSNLPVIYQVSVESPKMGANADLIGAILYAVNH